MTGRGRDGRPARVHRPPKPDQPRRIAFDILRAVDEREAYANLILPQALTDAGLESRDAGFATELTYGSLRLRGRHEAIIARCVDRPLDAIDAPVRDLLVLGVHQLHEMRVPDHAAVGSTVELARAVVGESRATLVNAVLRAVSRRSLDEWLEEITQEALSFDPPSDAMEVLHSHPRWVINAFRDALGGDLSEVEHLLIADNQPAPVTLVARPGRITSTELIQLGATPARWIDQASYWTGSLSDLPRLAQGDVGVQDEGSQLVTIALTRVPLSTDRLWLDLCAGPGGKGALLSAIAAERDPRIQILANEPQHHRARLVRRVVGANTLTITGDGNVPSWPAGSFDRVLVDAPCTGLGALRRRPEARWRRIPADVARLAPLQRSLLSSAVEAVRPGGVVAYVTCSPHVAETQLIIASVLAKHPEMTPLDAREFLPEVPELGDGPHAQLWPHRHGTDAMFLSLLQKAEQ
jgi:16S rRNA (cytosine967-C5)-methyltransferase